MQTQAWRAYRTLRTALLLFLVAGWPGTTFARDGGHLVVERLVAAGRIDRALNRCKAWEARGPDTYRALREACARAELHALRGTMELADWEEHARAWPGTLAAREARDAAAKLTLANLTDNRDPGAWWAAYERYLGTSAEADLRSGAAQVAFGGCERHPTIRCWQDFRARFPDSVRLDEAARAQAALALEDARRQDTIQGWESLARSYPEHLPLAAQRTAKLERSVAEERCDPGDPAGCAELGRQLVHGLGSARRLVEGETHLRRACEAGAGRACLDLGGRTSGATQAALFAKACEAGEALGCWGEEALRFDKAPRNLANFVEGTRAACERDVAEACALLPQLGAEADAGYAAGIRAVTLHWKDCERGEVLACSSLVGRHSALPPHDQDALVFRALMACYGSTPDLCSWAADLVVDTPWLAQFPREEIQAAAHQAQLARCSDGDPEACVAAAAATSLGLGTPEDDTLALALLRQAVASGADPERDDVDGFFRWGWLTNSRDGTATEIVEVLLAGHHWSWTRSALIQQKGERGGDSQLQRWLRRLETGADADCDAGEPKSCLALVRLYGDGELVSRDPRRVRLARVDACAAGDGESCAILGRELHHGQVAGHGEVPEDTAFGRVVGGVGDRPDYDPALALRYHRDACLLGVVASCWTAADMLRLGLEVPRDAQAGVDLLGRACAGGDPDACSEVESRAAEVDAPGIPHLRCPSGTTARWTRDRERRVPVIRQHCTAVGSRGLRVALGPATVHHLDGRPIRKEHYRGPDKVGVWESYDPDGEIRSTTDYTSGSPVVTQVKRVGPVRKLPPASRRGGARLAGGEKHTCGLFGGELLCWGNDEYGQLEGLAEGDGVSVSVGYGHTCVVTASGGIRCWGANNFGQASPPPEERFVEVDSGWDDTCGLTTDGRIVCWGQDRTGLGSPPGGSGFTEVRVGDPSACALDEDGRAVCWGGNRKGEAVPPADVRFVQLDVGYSHACGVTTTREVRCWGGNGWGKARPPRGTFVQVVTGTGHSCALDPRGQVRCWGSNVYGESSPDRTHRFVSLEAGSSYTCGLTPEAVPICWGQNSSGQSEAPVP